MCDSSLETVLHMCLKCWDHVYKANSIERKIKMHNVIDDKD